MKTKHSTSPSRRLTLRVLVVSLALTLASSAMANDSTMRDIAAGTAAQKTSAALGNAKRFETGSLQVDRHGNHGSPVILIPGLASGAWVWDDIVRRLQDKHVLYVVTLPGFDGRPAQAGKGMQAALDSLQQLIAAEHLERPVIIGHSLGGVLAMALAQTQPALVGGVVSIDGLPVFPGTEAMLVEQRPAMAASVKARMGSSDATMFAAQQGLYMQSIGVLDAVTAARLAKLTAKSDPAATAGFMAETLAFDLRSGLPGISAPVLLLSPYNPGDGAAQGMTEAAKTAYYRGLMAGTPRLEVQSISPSRHFAMFDQAEKVGVAIEQFLEKTAQLAP